MRQGVFNPKLKLLWHCDRVHKWLSGDNISRVERLSEMTLPEMIADIAIKYHCTYGLSWRAIWKAILEVGIDDCERVNAILKEMGY